MTIVDAPPIRKAPAWLILTLASLGQFLVVLDVSIVNVALPAMRDDLGFGATGLQWVVNAYALTFAGGLLLGGRAADLYGRKRVFAAGLAVFALASLAGGLATAPGLLIAARAVQGVGAALLAPATLTILTTEFREPGERARAVATWSAAGAAAGAVGSVLGGVLTEYLSWRSVLLLNVPVGLAVLAAAVWLLQEGRGGRARLDLIGAVLVTAGLSAVVYGTAASHDHGWTSAGTLVPLAAGLVLLVAFVLAELRAAAPLLPPRLLRLRPVSFGNLAMVLVGAAFFAMWYFLSLYMQGVLHYSAVRAGVAFLPHTAAIVVGARTAPALLRRMGPRALVALGAAIAVAGFLWQARLTATSGYLTGILGPGVVMCLGSGFLFTPIASTAGGAVGPEDAGIVSGLVNTARQVGGSLGLAALATLAAAPADPVAGYRHAFLAAAGLMAGVLALSPLVARPGDHHGG